MFDAVLGKTSTYYDTAAVPAPAARSQELRLTDDFGRPLEYTGPRFSERWKYDANGNLIEHRDRDGLVSRFTYESWNSLKDRIDPLGNVTSFAITVQGLVAKITDPGGAVTEYEYDLREKLVEVREAGGFVERYRSDAAGNRHRENRFFRRDPGTLGNWSRQPRKSSDSWGPAKSTSLNTTPTVA